MLCVCLTPIRTPCCLLTIFWQWTVLNNSLIFLGLHFVIGKRELWLRFALVNHISRRLYVILFFTNVLVAVYANSLLAT